MHSSDQLELLALAESVSSNMLTDIEVLRKRSNALVCRTKTSTGMSVIIKFWNRPGLRGLVRRRTGTSPLDREFRALLQMSESFPDSPRPLAAFRLHGNSVQHTEAIVVSDLGACQNAASAFKEVLARGDLCEAGMFQNKLVLITKEMLKRRLVDVDHRVSNFIVPTHQSPVRIDFEYCVRVPSLRAAPRMLGTMIGTLIGSHVFLTQPETDRSGAFTRQLFDAVGHQLSKRSISIAFQTVDQMLEVQFEKSGIRTRFRLVP